ncbi:MAG TPA: lipoyl domain-containing protein [Planctomycetota bacterium]|nr:lipoyl domain-containing protein [Planctomycetota bacterium]
MNTVEVKVPQLGDEENKVEEATISFWYFDVNQAVKEGDDLVEVVTDKADFRIPAPASGKLVKKNADEDEVVKIGDVIAVIETQG